MHSCRSSSCLGLLLTVAALGFLTSGCGGDDADDASARPRLQIEAVQEWAETFRSVGTEYTQALSAADAESYASVFDVDAVLQDGDDTIEGLPRLTSTAALIKSQNPDSRWDLVSTYIGEEGSGVVVSNLTGLGGQEPAVEYDILTIRDGLVAGWQVFYDPNTRPYFAPNEELAAPAVALLAEYEAAWSSADPTMIADLYAADARRDDSLFGDRAEGREGIQEYAQDFVTWYVPGTWRLVAPIGERQLQSPATGGAFSVDVLDADGQACEVRFIAILEQEAGSVIEERLYYDSDSVVACEWAT